MVKILAMQKLNFQPERLWYYFEEILKIPRASKKEEKIASWLLAFAEHHKLECRRDQAGNVLIIKPATSGGEQLPAVVLQSHMDMVCEKNSDLIHDFDKDPIIPRIDGEWVKASGTTLGADDGIGIAAQLAILESAEIVHGPLECLFTADEETGLSGAFGLKEGFLKGRILLNLDSEDEGELFIGCAGGRDTVAEIPLQWETCPESNTATVLVRVGGLKGGHSGDDIHKGLGNANKVLNRIVEHCLRVYDARLVSFEAGNLRNAIAREGQAIISVNTAQVKKIMEAVAEFETRVKAEFRVSEPDLFLNAEEQGGAEKVISLEAGSRLLKALYACPHGVMAYSQDIPGFVETSTNLASVRTKADHFLVTTSQRSSVESAKDEVCRMVASVFDLAGARVSHSDGYPGWAPNPASPLVKSTSEAYRRLFGREPKVLAIHAGLECGLIGEKYPGMDMISFGPTIKGAHSPDERLKIETVPMFWDLILEVLRTVR
jgi:dipeptidase D